MSFIDTLKRAFGFSTRGEEIEEEEYNYTSIGYAANNKAPQRNVDPRPVSEVDTPQAESVETVTPINAGDEHADYNRLKAAFDKVTAERDRYKQDKLSAERQKQALTDRVYDLEHQLTANEQEREKLFAENKRLEVKIKRLEANRLGSATDTAAVGDPAPNAEAEMLQAELDSRDKQIAQLNASLTEQKHVAAQLKHDLETLEVKSRMADTMVADLQSAAATSARQLQQSQAELKAANEELVEANANLELAAKAVSSVNRLEDLKYKQDLRIAELKRAVDMREKEIRSLNSTIEHNLRRHAENEALMREEIKQLRAGIIPEDNTVDVTETPEMTGNEPRRRRQRSKTDRRNGDNGDDNPGQMSLFS